MALDEETLPSTEEEVEDFMRNGNHGEFEKAHWFGKYRDAIRAKSDYNIALRDEMASLSEKIGDVVAKDYGTDIEVDIFDVYRPVRSHLPPIPCLCVYVTYDSKVSKELMAKLRKISRSNDKSLEKIRGLIVCGKPVGNIYGCRDEVGPYIMALARFVQSLGSSAQLGFNLVQIELDDRELSGDDGPCGFRGTPDDFAHFASVLEESCNDLTFFRFNANILAEPSDADVDLDLLLMAVQNRWSPVGGDHFSIVSNNFLRYAQKFTLMSFMRFTPFRCKVHTTCLSSTCLADQTGLDKFVAGVVTPTTSVQAPVDSVVVPNPNMESGHLHLSLPFPLSTNNERSIRKLLRENRLFVAITISESKGSVRVAGQTLQDFWEATFLGYTESVRFDTRPNLEGGREIINNTVAMAKQILPNNSTLKVFEPFHWYVEGTGYLGMAEHELIMVAVQPFLDGNKAKRPRVSA